MCEVEFTKCLVLICLVLLQKISNDSFNASRTCVLYVFLFFVKLSPLLNARRHQQLLSET